MKHRIAMSSLLTIYEAVALSSAVLFMPACSRAQTELRADRQILPEVTRGTWTVKNGPGGSLYVLTRSVKPLSSLWVSDNSGSSMLLGRCRITLRNEAILGIHATSCSLP